MQQAKEQVRGPAPREPVWQVAAVTVEMTTRVVSLPPAPELELELELWR